MRGGHEWRYVWYGAWDVAEVDGVRRALPSLTKGTAALGMNGVPQLGKPGGPQTIEAALAIGFEKLGAAVVLDPATTPGGVYYRADASRPGADVFERPGASYNRVGFNRWRAAMVDEGLFGPAPALGDLPATGRRR